MGSLLQVKGVKRSFGNLHALDGVSLDVEEKTVTILILIYRPEGLVRTWQREPSAVQAKK